MLPGWDRVGRELFEMEMMRIQKVKCPGRNCPASSSECENKLKQKTVSRCGFDGQSLPQGLCIAGSIYCTKFQTTLKRLQII